MPAESRRAVEEKIKLSNPQYQILWDVFVGTPLWNKSKMTLSTSWARGPYLKVPVGAKSAETMAKVMKVLALLGYSKMTIDAFSKKVDKALGS